MRLVGSKCHSLIILYVNNRNTAENLSRPVGKAVFYVKPSMTKWEVREYLTKIYNMDILKVETALHLGAVVTAWVVSCILTRLFYRPMEEILW